MKLEERLTALRQEKGLSQAEVAEQLDVSRQAISRWETGKVVPTVENLACLSRLYGVPMEALLYGDEGAEPVQQETKEEAVPETEETVQGTPERPAGTAPGKQKGSGTSRRKAAVLVLAAACILLACIVAYVVEEQRNMQADVVDIEDITADSVDVSGARKFDFETGW